VPLLFVSVVVDFLAARFIADSHIRSSAQNPKFLVSDDPEAI
jgi:hypothetical protein